MTIAIARALLIVIGFTNLFLAVCIPLEIKMAFPTLGFRRLWPGLVVFPLLIAYIGIASFIAAYKI